MMLVGDPETLLIVSGNGDVIEPDDGIVAIGSGGAYALAAARSLARHSSLTPEEIAKEALQVASEICIYTNDSINVVEPAVSDLRSFTPREIVSELDRYIVGQREAKRAVAIALRNRWRRQQVTGELQDEIAPKNIIMIGATGVGKTEIARRLAKMAQAPFIKVEASKFTEVGYVGRDVESIIRDLTELSANMVAEEQKKSVRAKAEGTRRRAPARRPVAVPDRGGAAAGTGAGDRAGRRAACRRDFQ